MCIEEPGGIAGGSPEERCSRRPVESLMGAPNQLTEVSASFVKRVQLIVLTVDTIDTELLHQAQR